MDDIEQSLLERSLDKIAAQNVIVEIYRDRLDSEPLVGRIMHRSDNIFIMRKLDELYRLDGFVAARISDITRVKWGGRELEAAARVAEKAELVLDWPEVALLEISSALTIFERRFGYISVYVECLSSNVAFIGETIELDDDFVHFRQFGTLKEMARSELLLRLEEITRVEVDGSYERQLNALYREGKPPR
jgi:hypothetical protein